MASVLAAQRAILPYRAACCKALAVVRVNCGGWQMVQQPRSVLQHASNGPHLGAASSSPPLRRLPLQLPCGACSVVVRSVCLVAISASWCSQRGERTRRGKRAGGARHLAVSGCQGNGSPHRQREHPCGGARGTAPMQALECRQNAQCMMPVPLITPQAQWLAPTPMPMGCAAYTCLSLACGVGLHKNSKGARDPDVGS